MTEEKQPNPNLSSGEPPEEFITQVRDGLMHLYDLSYLQGHPLAPAGASGGQQLKRTLLETVELLNPGPSFYFRAPQARPYNMLLLHFVEHVTVQKAASELGISERQAYRELREGENSVARLLWVQQAANSGMPEFEAKPEALRRAETITLGDLLNRAAATVQRLASQSGIQIDMDLHALPAIRPADQAAVRQILVSLLSRVVQASAGNVCIRSERENESTNLSFLFSSKGQPNEEDLPLDPIVQQLLQQMGWVYQRERGETGEQRIALRLESSAQTILLIDDDAGFAELLKRYINGLPFRLITAQSGLEGIELVRSARPTIIFLDVMMPGLDGWETLQRLQTDPETMGIPLIICSVFNDPELARSLGARRLLPKPVSREAFLAALETMGVL